MIDATGNTQGDARASYSTTATVRTFPPSALRDGEELLIAAGFLRLEDGRLIPTPALAGFVAIGDDSVAALALDKVIVERNRQVDLAAIGALGEEHILGEVRDELLALHRDDLAERCERVSLVSDYFGYDITAPMATGTGIRRLEVKTQSVEARPPTVRFFLSRNEYDVGRSNPAEWALVACWRGPHDVVETVGWCRAAALAAYLPVDQSGRWTEALVQMPSTVLTAGFPPAI